MQRSFIIITNLAIAHLKSAGCKPHPSHMDIRN